MFFIKPLSAILTFALGVTGFLYFARQPLPQVMPAQFATEPTYVMVADLTRDPELYDTRIVTMRGHLQLLGQGNGTLTDGGAGPEWLNVLCEDGYSSCDALMEDIRDAGPEPVQFEFTGRFFAPQSQPVAGLRRRDGYIEVIETHGVYLKRGQHLEAIHRDRQSGEIKFCDSVCGGGYSGGEDAASDPKQKKVSIHKARRKL